MKKRRVVPGGDVVNGSGEEAAWLVRGSVTLRNTNSTKYRERAESKQHFQSDRLRCCYVKSAFSTSYSCPCRVLTLFSIQYLDY